MHALTVRRSLDGVAQGVAESLAWYVAETSHARFTGAPGLRFKTRRVRAGEWFEASDVVAVAGGGAGFIAAPSYA